MISKVLALAFTDRMEIYIFMPEKLQYYFTRSNYMHAYFLKIYLSIYLSNQLHWPVLRNIRKGQRFIK